MRIGQKHIEGHKGGASPKLGNEEIAFAFEMIQEGLQIKWICRALGVVPWTLYNAMRNAKKIGMRKE